MKVLIIGGPSNGAVVEVEDKRTHVVLGEPQISTMYAGNGADAAPELVMTTYQIECITVRGQRFFVGFDPYEYRAGYEETIALVMDRLFMGYWQSTQ